MPKCSSCNKVFKDQQVLDNYRRIYLNDSDEDIPLFSYKISQNLVEITSQVLNNQNISKKENMSEKAETNNKRKCFKYNLDNRQERAIFNEDESIKVQNLGAPFSTFTSNMKIYNEFTKREDIGSFNYSDSQSNASNEEYYSDSQSNAFNEKSDLLDISEVDTNEYIKYNDLLSDKPKDPEDIFQKFPSKEYAEFMNIITQFHVQDTLANVFIKFFNKYSNRNNHPLSSISKASLEYALEFRTVLNGIYQILLNNSITEEFVIEYKMSTDKAFAAMLQSLRLLSNTRVHLYINSNLKWFYPYLALVILDWPETCSMCAIYGSPNCSYLELYKYQLKFTIELLKLHYGNRQIKILKEQNWTLQNIENEPVFIEIFDFTYLNNNYKVVIHASSNYYSQGAFSDICIEMDKSEENDYLTDDGLC
ncbi:27501_t:CDS:2 [Gigaspora margarita]|uniref:27501_t:CDS:1 n=1 Tax=Gigaspora margarita TaxID=4874 RepID=A0ABN7VD72_GIGMA|nr:27501_t:CDS:2 [Gigaspora margarita]